ncbi:MAG: hypothetical protein GXP41_06790 [Chloroflexi bacterium]|nr:hypothetical protein [Chloroflexota bacterium]
MNTTNEDGQSLPKRLFDSLWATLGSPKTTGYLLAGILLGWGATWLVPQMPASVEQDSRLAAQWVADRLQGGGLAGKLLAYAGIFDIRHAFWFTLLWAGLAAALSIGLADSCMELLWQWRSGHSRSWAGTARRVGRTLFYAGALFALAGLYWGDQHSFSTRVSLLPGQQIAIGHNLPWSLRFDGFDAPPATVGEGRELRGRATLLDFDGTARVSANLSARQPLQFENLTVRPIWFGRRVRLSVRDEQGASIRLRVGKEGPSSDEAILFFGQDEKQEVLLPAKGWRLTLDYHLDSQAVLVEMHRPPLGEGDESARTDRVAVVSPATFLLAGVTVHIESDTYATLATHYQPGRKLLFRGLGLAVLGLVVLALARIFLPEQFRV